jgi:uncharacterized protein
MTARGPKMPPVQLESRTGEFVTAGGRRDKLGALRPEERRAPLQTEKGEDDCRKANRALKLHSRNEGRPDDRSSGGVQAESDSYDRECGSCTACCELLEVIELNKPRGVLCQHCTSGKGCAIYARRPDVCRDYECGWLAHHDIPDELRPDRCGFILDTTRDKRVVLIHVNQRKMREQKRRVTQLYKFAERIVRSGKPVVFSTQIPPRRYACGPVPA